MKAIVMFDETYAPIAFDPSDTSEWPEDIVEVYRQWGREFDIPREKWDHIQYVYWQLEGVNRYLTDLITSRTGQQIEAFHEEEQTA